MRQEKVNKQEKGEGEGGREDTGEGGSRGRRNRNILTGHTVLLIVGVEAYWFI